MGIQWKITSTVYTCQFLTCHYIYRLLISNIFFFFFFFFFVINLSEKPHWPASEVHHLYFTATLASNAFTMNFHHTIICKHKYCLYSNVFTAGGELRWGDEVQWQISAVLWHKSHFGTKRQLKYFCILNKEVKVTTKIIYISSTISVCKLCQVGALI